MNEFHFHKEQLLPAPLERVFAFYADAANLERLTPPWLSFRILTPAPIDMRGGARIDYRIRIHGIPVTWRSEITEWDPPHRFVDEQLSGPYRRWIHLHTFEETADGTLVRDDIRYAVPGGRVVQRFFVAPDIARIFEYRRVQLERIFPPQR